MSLKLQYTASQWKSSAVIVLFFVFWEHNKQPLSDFEQDTCSSRSGSAWPPVYLSTHLSHHPPHHNRLKKADEGAEATPLLHQSPAHRLLLCLLHQQTHVSHILHGTVQLRLQVHSPCGVGRKTNMRWKGMRQAGQGEDDGRQVGRKEGMKGHTRRIVP